MGTLRKTTTSTPRDTTVRIAMTVAQWPGGKAKGEEEKAGIPMNTKLTTLDKLRSLEELYHQGYGTKVIDRTVDKLLAMEAEQADKELRDWEARLAKYEQQFSMTSSEFYRRFRAGELGDEMDFVEWSVFYDMYQAMLRRLRLLGAEER